MIYQKVESEYLSANKALVGLNLEAELNNNLETTTMYGENIRCHNSSVIVDVFGNVRVVDHTIVPAYKLFLNFAFSLSVEFFLNHLTYLTYKA